jgi:flagellar motor switch protein FliM
MSAQDVLGQDEIDALMQGVQKGAISDTPPEPPPQDGAARNFDFSEGARIVRGRSPTLDGSNVQRPNTAMLQLLASFARELQQQSRSIEWVGQSEPLSRAAKALGLDGALTLS